MDVLSVLNDLFFISKVCNEIVHDYLKMTVKFKKKINFGTIKDMVILNNDLYINNIHDIFRVNIKTKKIKHITIIDPQNDTLVNSNGNYALAIINNKLIDLTNMQEKKINVKLNNHTIRCDDGDDKILFNQYYYNGVNMYIQDALEMKRYSLIDKKETKLSLLNIFEAEPVIDMTNDDVYLYNTDIIIKMNCLLPDHTEKIKLGMHKYVYLFVHGDELYIIDRIAGQLVVFDKYTLLLLREINISSKCSGSDSMLLVVSDKYIVMSSKRDLYIYEKN